MRNSSKILFIICSIMLISGICLRLTLPSSTPLKLTQPAPTQSILLLPLDSRPVCSTMVQKLGTLAGLNVILPPKACLDNYRTPSASKNFYNGCRQNSPNTITASFLPIICCTAPAGRPHEHRRTGGGGCAAKAAAAVCAGKAAGNLLRHSASARQ